MHFAIIYGKDDLAGKNIIESMNQISFTPQIPIIKIKKHPIYITEKELKELNLKTDFIVFASTHKSKKNEPSLSLHAPGNWRDNKLGGEKSKVSMTSSLILKYLFIELNKNAEQDKHANENKNIKDKYNITLECTHHGPSINTPCCFIEIGSNEQQWTDKQAGEVIAKTILSLQDYELNPTWIPSFLIGGGHYNQAANKIMLRTKYAVGHIIPKYQLPITDSIIHEAEKKTQEQVKIALLDWKGLGKYKKETIDKLDKVGLKYDKVQKILKGN